jgi:hypothetical protein
MSFNGSEGNEISPAKAADMTKAYRQANPGKEQSVFMGADILRRLLEQPGTQGIRFYYSLDGETPALVAVSADDNENDLLGDEFLIADEGVNGPPRSGCANFLNS